MERSAVPTPVMCDSQPSANKIDQKSKPVNSFRNTCRENESRRRSSEQNLCYSNRVDNARWPT